MLRFKEYITEKADITPYIPADPIHFAYVGLYEDDSEPNTNLSTWKKSEGENEHLGKTSVGISKTLIKSRPKLSAKDIHYAKDYTSGSYGINRHLLEPHDEDFHYLVRNHPDRIPALKKITSHPIGHEVHVYSGIGFDPREHMKNGKLSSPAFMSFTHHKPKAAAFAASIATKASNNKPESHILHVHMKPTDKGLHVNDISKHFAEHETILPPNTRLNVHPVPETYWNDHHVGTKTHIWHATIEHQE